MIKSPAMNETFFVFGSFGDLFFMHCILVLNDISSSR